MAEVGSNTPNNTPLGYLERLTALGEPVTAGEHPTFQELISLGLGNIDPAMVVARRVSRVRTDDTVRSTVTLEHLTPQGLSLLSDFYNTPTTGSFTIRSETDASFTVGHRHYTGPRHSLLHVDIDQDGTTDGRVEAAMPLAPDLVSVTRSEWKKWGYEFIYRPSPGGEVIFGTSPPSNDAEAIAARLAIIESDPGSTNT